MGERCTNCKTQQPIVYRDYYNDFAYEKGWAFLKLCFICLRKHLPELLPDVIMEIGSNKFSTCANCQREYIKDPDKPWATICVECWKLKKGYINYNKKPKKKQPLNEMQIKCKNYLDNTSGKEELQVCSQELKDGKVNSTKNEPYCYFSPELNTMLLSKFEIVIEIESENPKTNWKGTIQTAIKLCNDDVQFKIFYALGMKTPHIRIFNIENIHDLDPLVRRATRKLFAEKYTPLEYRKYIDTKLYGSHKIQIPYSIHWKYKTPYIDIFENEN